jgi:hypothetical protein
MSLLEIILEKLMNYGHIVDEEMSQKTKITALSFFYYKLQGFLSRI